MKFSIRELMIWTAIVAIAVSHVVGDRRHARQMQEVMLHHEALNECYGNIVMKWVDTQRMLQRSESVDHAMEVQFINIIGDHEHRLMELEER